MRQTIGLPLKDCVQILGNFNDSEALTGAETYWRLFPIYEIGHIGIFSQVPETLALLNEKKVRMAICTSRNKFSLDSILQRHHLQHYFETIITADTHALRPKPAPDMALVLMERMGTRANETLVVGDTIFDIEMGRKAHCPTVAVTYGNHSRHQLLASTPNHIIDHFNQLVPIVETTQ